MKAEDVDLEVAANSSSTNISSDVVGYGSLRVPAGIEHFAADVLDKEVTPVLPLVLMFKNDSVVLNKVITSAEHEEASSLESTAISQNSKVSELWSGDVSLPITALPDNQISLTSAENPTTAGSVVFDQGDKVQATASIQIEPESSKLTDEPQSPVTNRVPVRNKGQNKRPRPKPSTNLVKNVVDITSTTPPSVETMTTTSTEVTESLADQQANLLQFLVSNPPAWVLDEIINGSTLTTWYPLPIAGRFSVIVDRLVCKNLKIKR